MQKQLATIDKDFTIIEKKLLPLENAQMNALPFAEDQPSTSGTSKTASTSDSPTSKTAESSKKPRGEEKLASRKVHVHSNFEELLDDYFTTKIPAHKGECEHLCCCS